MQGKGLGKAVAVFGAAAMVVVACGGSPTETGASNDGKSAVVASAQASDGGTVIAVYAGKQFTEADLRRELGRMNRRSRKALLDVDRLKQFVENYVVSDLIYEQGKKQGLPEDPEIQRQLEDLERRLVIQKVMQEHQSAPVSDDEVKQYYDSHPEEFSSDRVKASHILVKDEALAKDLLAQLREDPSKWDALAEENSIDKSNSSRGGDLGYFTRGRMVKEFEDASFALTEDGQISDVVQTRFGYHIIKRTGREDGAMKSFDDVKNQIRIRLINDKRRQQTETFLEELKSSSGYEVKAEVISQLDLSDMDEDEGADGGAAQSPHGGH